MTASIASEILMDSCYQKGNEELTLLSLNSKLKERKPGNSFSTIETKENQTSLKQNILLLLSDTLLESQQSQILFM